MWKISNVAVIRGLTGAYSGALNRSFMLSGNRFLRNL
jgi:hypothetical protein